MDYMTIGLELGVLAFFGLLYYFFQRRRIIRHNIQEIFFFLDRTIYSLHEYLDDKKNATSYNTLNDFTSSLEEIKTIEDLYKLDLLLKEIPTSLPLEIRIELQNIHNQIQFHLS